MFLQLLLAIIAGIFAGVITGLTPGIHINLVSLLLVSVSGYLLGFVSPLSLGVFIVAMAIVHTFLDIIPSVFLGAPDDGQALNALPGHKLLLQGKGYEAVKFSTIGSLVCLIATIAIIPFLVPVLPYFYSLVQPYIGWMLILVVAFMVLKEKGWLKKTFCLFVFLLSGVLGIIVLDGLPNLEQPLFPLLSGLFGISTLVISLSNKVRIPSQKVEETLKINKKELIKIASIGTLVGSIAGLFPGLGASQAAIIGSQLVKTGRYSFITLVGGINTVNFTFSLAALYAIQKARNGAVVAMMEILKSIDLSTLIVFLSAALLAGGIAAFLAMYFARIFAKLITKVNYQSLCIGIIAFISLMVLYFCSWMGLIVLIVSICVGTIPNIASIKKSYLMGCLLLPVILYFVI